MRDHNDGGPVFPVFKDENNYGETFHLPLGGMSLRDWFAGQALAGILACSIPGVYHGAEQATVEAYRIADAMLAARQ